MEVELGKKGKCISKYDTLTETEHTNSVNNLYKSKRAFTQFRRESCVCRLVCIGVSYEQKLSL
jgi:hypothetical protein